MHLCAGLKEEGEARKEQIIKRMWGNDPQEMGKVWPSSKGQV